MDFPLFERDPATGALGAVNHPFTAPHPDDLHLLDTAPEQVRALAYDMVLNGTELGGGSLRIADPALQRRIFGLLGIADDVAEQRFGFLLEGLRAGAPPHGGFAFGMDRIVMLLSGRRLAARRDRVSQDHGAAGAVRGRALTPVDRRPIWQSHIWSVNSEGEK